MINTHALYEGWTQDLELVGEVGGGGGGGGGAKSTKGGGCAWPSS